MRQGVTARRFVVLLLWALGILLPMAWLVRFSPTGARVFDLVFGPLWVHVLMHALLFGVLGWLGARAMRHALPTAPGMWMLGALLLVAAVGLLQEWIQLYYKARPIGADELFDIGVDLAAGAVGVAAALWQARRTRKGRGALDLCPHARLPGNPRAEETVTEGEDKAATA